MLPLYCLNLAFKISLDLFKPLARYMSVGGGLPFRRGVCEKKREAEAIMHYISSSMFIY